VTERPIEQATGASNGNTIALVVAIFGIFAVWGTGLPVWAQGSITLFVFGAVAMLANAPDLDRTEKLAAWIEGDDFGWGYRKLVGRRLAKLWTRFADPAPCGTKPLGCFWAAFTWKTYDFAMLLAVIYPIAALILVWLGTGKEARIGSEPVFPEIVRSSLPHIATIGLIALFAIPLKMMMTS